MAGIARSIRLITRQTIGIRSLHNRSVTFAVQKYLKPTQNLAQHELFQLNQVSYLFINYCIPIRN